MLVDYAGHTVPIIDSIPDRSWGGCFVTVLGACNYTYAEATLDQCLPNWIGSHVRALEFFVGVPAGASNRSLRRGSIRNLCPRSRQIQPIEHDNIRGMPLLPLNSAMDINILCLGYLLKKNCGGLSCTHGQVFEEQLSSPDCKDLSFEDRLGLMVDRGATDRGNRRLQTRLRNVKLRLQACMEDIDIGIPGVWINH